MTAYIIRRLLAMIPIILGVTFLTFAIINIIPGSPVLRLRDNPKIRPEAAAALEEQLGLNKPLFVNLEAFKEQQAAGVSNPLTLITALTDSRYLNWLADLARGDLGVSLYNQLPVADRIF